VTDVYAFKRDCFTVDQICLLVGNPELDQWIQVNEDDGGYSQFIAELPVHLVGCPSPDEWWKSVALPPFETQWTQIYHRSASARTRPEKTIDTTHLDQNL
jgi:hypothetical protein